MRELGKKLTELVNKFSEKGAARTILWCAVIAGTFLFVLIINCLTPLLADDYYYIQNRVTGESNIVATFSDFMRSLSNSRNLQSGRTLTFMFYHAFAAAGKTFFNIVDAISYMIAAFLMYYLIKGEGKHSVTLFTAINLSIWLFTPELGQDIFWISGAINYLLPMLPITGIFLTYKRHMEKPSDSLKIPKAIMIFLLAVLAGWSLENSGITVPIVTGLYILFYKNRKIKIPMWAISGFAGAVLGYAALLIAPGNYKRYENELESVSLSPLFKVAIISYYWIMFIGVLTAIFIIGVILCIRKGEKTALYQGLIFAVAALASAYCMIAAPSSPERTWFITVCLMTVADGIVLRAVKPNIANHRPITAVCCTAALIILAAMAADTVLTTYDIREQFIAREQYILAEKDKGNMIIEVPVYKNKYPFKAHRDALYGLYDLELGENAPNSFNWAIADYYGVYTLIGTYE